MSDNYSLKLYKSSQMIYKNVKKKNQQTNKMRLFFIFMNNTSQCKAKYLPDTSVNKKIKM